MEKEELQGALEEAEGALEQEENKVIPSITITASCCLGAEGTTRAGPVEAGD